MLKRSVVMGSTSKPETNRFNSTGKNSTYLSATCCINSRLKATIASVTLYRILSKLLSVASNLSETDLIASGFEMNHTHIKTCFCSGIAFLLKQFPWGIDPVAASSWLSDSKVFLVIRKCPLNSSSNRALPPLKKKPF